MTSYAVPVSSQQVTPPRVAPREVHDTVKSFGVLDVLVIFICLSAAAGGIYFFYNSLFQTLTSNLEPIGTVTIRYNSIQRRQGDRVLWDRLQNESPLYPGDLIRVAELSGATLNFDDNQLELNENTLIRVNIRNGRPQIELSSGTLNLDTTFSTSNISLVVSGRVIEPTAGTVLSAAAISDDDGNTTLALQVMEGSAAIVEDGQTREINEGTIIALTADGTDFVIQDDGVMDMSHLVNLLAEHENNIELSSLFVPAVPEEIEIINNEEMTVPLAAPQLIQPNNGFVIRPAELERMNYRIVFRWSPVNEANAYVFTLFHQTAAGRRQVVQTSPQGANSYTLTNMRLLDRGTFVWQVEAVYASGDVIIRRGNMQESTFTVNIPASSGASPQEPGTLYGL